MEKLRKPCQGVWNIIRFNWHFYILATLLIVGILFISSYVTVSFNIYFYLVCFAIAVPAIISLLVSFYIYDLSGLYVLSWLDELNIKENTTILNIHAGFDETSTLLKNKYPTASLVVCDFYDPMKHTEISIKRARKAYPLYPDTLKVITTEIPLSDNTFDAIFVIFAAHEIRDIEERISFFKELKRIIKPTGKIIVTEHLRDSVNFLAYTIGFLHFYTRQCWLNVFANAKLFVVKEKKTTSFISTFILDKNDFAA